MFIARDSPPRKQRAPSATPTQSEKSPVHHKMASQSEAAEDFAFPPLDQMGSFKKSHKSTFSVSGPGSLVGDRPSNVSHKVTSSLPRPSPNRAGTLYDTAATRAAKAGISLSLIDSAASAGASEHVRPRSSLTRLDQARQEAGGETPRAVKEAKSRFENGATSERRTIDVQSVQLVVDQPKLPTLSSPTKARAAASQQTPRQASPSKGQSAVDAEFERKLLAAMEGGVNPFLDKRKATMRGAASTATPTAPALADEWGVMAPDATPRRAAHSSTLPSPIRQTPQQQKPLYNEEDSATPRAARAIQREVASPYTATPAKQVSPDSDMIREPERTVARDEEPFQPSSQATHGSQQMEVSEPTPVAKSPLRSPSKRIDSFLDTSDDGPSTKELTAKLNGLQIEYHSLQQKLQGAQEDAQGWQSEASRLETELAEAQQAKLEEATRAAAPNGAFAETTAATGDEVLRRKYDDLKLAYQDLKVAKDEAVWMALCSTETGLDALRKAQFELICAKQEAYHEAARRAEDEQQLTRAVRIARSRGQKVKNLAAANAELEEQLEQEVEKNARLREELETAKKAALRKAPVASTASLGAARRRANPAAFASDAAPSSSEMDVDEEDGDSSFAAHAVKTSSRVTGATKSIPTSRAAPAKSSSSSVSSSNGLREKIIARAEPQPRKRPAYPVLEDDSDKESEEEAQVSDEQDEEDEQAEVENDSFVVLKPSATASKAAAPAASTRKAPAAAAAAAAATLKAKTTTSSGSSLASKRSSVISSTLTASTAASRIRAQEARVAQSPPAAAPVKKSAPIKATPLATSKSSSATAASRTAAAAKAAAAAAAEAEALDATKKKKRRLLGGGGAGANPLLFGGTGAANGPAGKKLLGSGVGAGEDEEAENLLNPTLDLPVTLSPVKGFGGKLGMGTGVGTGRFGLGGKAGGGKSMFG
ncbi:hypothetical protein BCV69DRAFT_281517 [Microstroma glucosiphilum]|uniref:Uncharacterized protein n=1 Tax=Pseudomicrostroma glucosiphilum TaxID=1684307 RepID=A0A316UCE3_9BASI|nr:hypothetical protein BCV69DRAFT_281517 [Pseudomicrostroma glucosiphilum]PWN22538.1 hypothetical protein BCV69DRAFT_281517 [Pseudomicrostroma glucosiphilum]